METAEPKRSKGAEPLERFFPQERRKFLVGRPLWSFPMHVFLEARRARKDVWVCTEFYSPALVSLSFAN